MPKVSNIFSGRIEQGSSWTRNQQSLDQMVQRVQYQLMHIPTPTYRPIRHARDPMRITTRAWMRAGHFIDLWVNPSDMQWSLPRRGTVVKTAAGAVRNTWRNRYKGTYYDEGTVNITFQTGNIMPSMGYPDSLDLQSIDDISRAIAHPKVPPGLQNFYDFLELLNQGALSGPATNEHIIYHRSRVFPSLTLHGFFTEDSMSFSELATDGNMLQWSATFQIYWTTPKLYSSSALSTAYTDFISASAQGEVVGQDNIDRVTFVEGISSVPGKMPAGQPKTGPNATGAVTTVASSPQKTNKISDNMINNAANKIKKSRDVGALFGF